MTFKDTNLGAFIWGFTCPDLDFCVKASCINLLVIVTIYDLMTASPRPKVNNFIDLTKSDYIPNN